MRTAANSCRTSCNDRDEDGPSITLAAAEGVMDNTRPQLLVTLLQRTFVLTLLLHLCTSCGCTVHTKPTQPTISKLTSLFFLFLPTILTVIPSINIYRSINVYTFILIVYCAVTNLKVLLRNQYRTDFDYILTFAQNSTSRHTFQSNSSVIIHTPIAFPPELQSPSLSWAVSQ